MEDPDKLLDLLRQTEYPCDTQLLEVYADCVHRNPGKHLHGGVANNEAMQMLYAKVIATPHPLYSPPKGSAGKRFIVAFAGGWRKVRKRERGRDECSTFCWRGEGSSGSPPVQPICGRTSLH